MASFDKGLFKAAQKINNRNRKWAQERANQQALVSAIGQIGQSVPQVIGAFQQNSQNQQMATQLGVDPSMTRGLSNRDLLPLALKLREAEAERARNASTSTLAASMLGLDGQTGAMTPSELADIARAKAYAEAQGGTAAQMWTVPEEFRGAYGENVPSGAASSVIQGINQERARKAFEDASGGKVTLGVDAAGNTIVVPLTEKTVGAVAGRMNTRENIEGRQAVVDTQQEGMDRRLDQTNQNRLAVAAMRADTQARLKQIDEQIAAGNRDTRLMIARESLAQRDRALAQVLNTRQQGFQAGIIGSTIRNELDPDIRTEVRASAEEEMRRLRREGATAPVAPTPAPTQAPTTAPTTSDGPIAVDAAGNRVQWNGTAWVPIK